MSHGNGDHCERSSEKITRDPPQAAPCVFPPRRSTSLSGEWEGRNEGGERERTGWNGSERMAPISSFSLFTTIPTSLLIMRLSERGRERRESAYTARVWQSTSSALPAVPDSNPLSEPILVDMLFLGTDFKTITSRSEPSEAFTYKKVVWEVLFPLLSLASLARRKLV